jgi:hypothetical protein
MNIEGARVVIIMWRPEKQKDSESEKKTARQSRWWIDSQEKEVKTILVAIDGRSWCAS